MKEHTGLYIHIPYCKNKCSYCDFFKEESDVVKNDYIDFLLKEARFYSEEEKVEIDTIYFGGGTPSLISPEQLQKLFNGLKEFFSFSDNCEITLETNPENIEEKKFQEFKNVGINRFSIGIQSLDEKVLSILSRRISAKEILEKIEIISKIGFEHLSFDLIIGAPFSNNQSVLNDLKILLSYPFCHASLYILEIHKKTRLYEIVKNGLTLPGDEETIKSLQIAGKYLKDKGYEHYEISNFCKKGCECRHNLKYWRRNDYIGLGPSSSSYFRGFKSKNPNSIDVWQKYLSKGDFPAEEIFKEENEEKLEDKIIFGLRLKEGIEYNILEEYVLRSGADFSRIEKLFKSGLINKEGTKILLSEEGFLVSNEIITFILSDKYRCKTDGEEE